MPQVSADSETVAAIRRLAEAGRHVVFSHQARSDLIAHNLTRDDALDALVAGIDAGERVKPVSLHSFRDRQGQTAYEIKPKIDDVRWYLKVCFDDPASPDDGLAVLSAHPDHG